MNGVAFAADNRTMQDNDWAYRSDKPKLTVDGNANPPHLKPFELAGGTQFSIVHGDLKQETLMQFEHHLPWPPMFLCYFFTENVPSAFAANIGQYLLNQAQMRYNGDTWFEWLQASVDAKYFYIKHYVQYNGGTDVGAQTSYGSQYQFRVRLEIIARKATFTGQ